MSSATAVPQRWQCPREAAALLPKGAKVIQTAVSDDRIVVTVELSGTVENRAFDIKTMQPTGRLASPPSPEAAFSTLPEAGNSGACLTAGSGLVERPCPTLPRLARSGGRGPLKAEATGSIPVGSANDFNSLRVERPKSSKTHQIITCAVRRTLRLAEAHFFLDRNARTACATRAGESMNLRWPGWGASPRV